MTSQPMPADGVNDRRLGGPLAIVEWLVAVGLTLFLFELHFENWRVASALWRDELTTLHIATRPSFAELWSLTEWESLPLLWPLALRTWIDLGLGADAASLRMLALWLGVLIILSLFFALRSMAKTPPLLALLLVAANPTVIRFGDTIRGYGLGLLLAILLVVAYWALTVRISRGRAAVAAAVSILSVQCLYHDAVVVFALATACSAAWAYRRRTREAVVPLAIGGLTALTLIPYLGPLARAQEWNVLIRGEVTIPWLVRKLRHAIELDGPWISRLWVLLAVVAFGVFARQLARRAPASPDLVELRARAVFFATGIILSVVAYATFLVLVGYPTQVWYYVTLLGVAGVLLEAGLMSQAGASAAWRIARITAVVAMLPLVIPALAQRFPQRLTNMDLIAGVLAERARPEDLILVNPWYLAISFDHYYQGRAPWHSIPDVSDRKLTRYDLVKQVMTRPEAIERIADRVQETLTAGGRVWVVGDLSLVPGNPPPKPVPIAPSRELGWNELRYLMRWSRVVAHRIQRYANRRSSVPIDETIAVGPFERPGLQLFEAERPHAEQAPDHRPATGAEPAS